MPPATTYVWAVVTGLRSCGGVYPLSLAVATSCFSTYDLATCPTTGSLRWCPTTHPPWGGRLTTYPASALLVPHLTTHHPRAGEQQPLRRGVASRQTHAARADQLSLLATHPHSDAWSSFGSGDVRAGGEPPAQRFSRSRTCEAPLRSAPRSWLARRAQQRHAARREQGRRRRQQALREQ